MPLLIIHSLPPADKDAVPAMLADVRDSGARALGCPPDNVWVMFEPVAPGWYAHGSSPADKPQQSTHPPVVLAKAQSGRTPEQRDAFAAAVAAAVGRGLSVPAGNVWLHYEEMRPQDVWYGGRWAAEAAKT